MFWTFRFRACWRPPASTGSIILAVDSTVPPAIATEIIQQAILNCVTIITTPAPSITINGISACATEFGITFFAADFAAAGKVQHELLDLVYRHLAAAGIRLAAAMQTVTPPPDTRTRPQRVLDIVDIFAALPASERSAITAKPKSREYQAYDTVLKPGTAVATHRRQRGPIGPP